LRARDSNSGRPKRKPRGPPRGGSGVRPAAHRDRDHLVHRHLDGLRLQGLALGRGELVAQVGELLTKP